MVELVVLFLGFAIILLIKLARNIEPPSQQSTKQTTSLPVFGPTNRVVRLPVNKVILHVSPDGDVSSAENIHEELKTLRSEKVVGALTHQKVHIFGLYSGTSRHCRICLELSHTVFSIAVDSARTEHRRCCLRCLRTLGGQQQLERAIQESERAADVWRYMQVLDQLRSDFPDPTHRPWGEEMLLDAITWRSLGPRGERIVQKIKERKWEARDLARIEGRPDPGPTTQENTFSGTGRMMFPEGKSVPVTYKIILCREFRDGHLCSSWVSGWVWDMKGYPLEKGYLGKKFILEMQRNKTISVLISKEDGSITCCLEYARNGELAKEEEVTEMWDTYLLQCGRLYDVLPIVERRIDRCPPAEMPEIEVRWLLDGLQRVSTSTEGVSPNWLAKAQRIAGEIVLARGDKEGAITHFKQALAFNQKVGVAKLLRRLQHEQQRGAG